MLAWIGFVGEVVGTLAAVDCTLVAALLGSLLVAAAFTTLVFGGLVVAAGAVLTVVLAGLPGIVSRLGALGVGVSVHCQVPFSLINAWPSLAVL